jgi:hypothetical protein
VCLASGSQKRSWPRRGVIHPAQVAHGDSEPCPLRVAFSNNAGHSIEAEVTQVDATLHGGQCADGPAANSQSLMPRVGGPRPSLRSDDGQAILKLIWTDQALSPDLVFWVGGHSWVRTSDPSLVRIATTAPLPLACSTGPGQRGAGPSTMKREGAWMSRTGSHLRSHIMITNTGPRHAHWPGHADHVRPCPRPYPAPLTDNLPVGITVVMPQRSGKFYLKTRKITSGIAEESR